MWLFRVASWHASKATYAYCLISIGMDTFAAAGADSSCISYVFVPDIYTSSCTGPDPTGVTFMFAPPATHGVAPAGGGRKMLYRPILSKLRQLMICRMAKPEEVGWSPVASHRHLNTARRQIIAGMM